MSDPPNAPQPDVSQLSNWHIRLRQILVSYFDEDELETLCFDLRIDYQCLAGTGKAKKVIELVNNLARSGRIGELIDHCSQLRPNVPWSELRAAAVSNPLVVDREPYKGLAHDISNRQRVKSPSSDRSNALYMAAIGVAAAGLVGLIVVILTVRPLISVTIQPTSLPTEDSSAVVRRVTPTATRPRPDTATPQDLALPLVVFDSFSSNTNGWWVGDDGKSISCNIANSKYRCELKPHTAEAHWHWLGQTLATEFYLAVDAQHVSGGKDSESSLMFRRVGINHYLFSIRDDQTFRLIYFYNETTIPLIDWSKSGAIRPDQINRLAVRAEDTHYTLLINDLQVGEIDDNRLSNGLAGLHVFSNTADEPAIIEFDNYELRQR